MSVKALFMHWPVALKEPERVLDDLALWTDINTIIVSNIYWKWGQESSPLILPPLNTLQAPHLQKVLPEEYVSMMDFLSMAKEKGFIRIEHLHYLTPPKGNSQYKYKIYTLSQKEKLIRLTDLGFAQAGIYK